MKEKQPANKESVKNAVVESLRFFDDVVVREHIYRLNLQRMQILDEIENLEKRKE